MSRQSESMTDRVDPRGGTLSIALSGGGVRASLFSLGVLLYVADAGLSERVRLISSVSGGSITNAATALAGDFSQTKPAEFRGLAGRLSHALVKQGSFFLPTMRKLGSYIFVAFALFILLIRTWRWLSPQSIDQEAASFLRTALLYLAITALAFAAALNSRDELQKRKYRNLLFTVAHGGDSIVGQIKRRRRIRLQQLPESRVTHVLCATELNSGRPMFFSRDWTQSPAYGWGPSSIELAEAVYASAAFPGLFPPLRIRSSLLPLSGGHVPGPSPAVLVLADGGAYNNLATQWERLAARMRDNPWEVDKRFRMPPLTDFHLVVNASAPPRAIQLSRSPVMRSLLAFIRVTIVMYENTVRPRLSALRGVEAVESTALIDLAESPLEAVERLASSPSFDAEERARAVASIKLLKLAPQNYWIEFRGTTSTLKTTLAPIGTAPASSLLRHAYLSASAVLNARLGTPGPASVPPVHWFDELVRTGKSVEALLANGNAIAVVASDAEVADAAEKDGLEDCDQSSRTP
jgi:predicted acylesterase/phospholipase RssA